MSKWHESMAKKLKPGQTLSDYMRELRTKSSANNGKGGGFAKLKEENPELLREISIKAGVKSGEVRGKK